VFPVDEDAKKFEELNVLPNIFPVVEEVALIGFAVLLD